MRDMEKIPKGSRVLVTTGEYSDYGVRTSCVAAEDIDPAALLEEWLADKPQQREPYKFREDEFLGWLTSRGLLVEETYIEWHLSDYGSVSDMDVTTHPPR